MRRAVCLAALAAACVGLLAGCGSKYDLTDEENDMVAEYMAVALLRYDMDYDEKLIYEGAEPEPEEETFVPDATLADDPADESVPEPELEPDAASPSEDSGDSGQEAPAEEPLSSLADVMDGKGYSVAYDGFEECDSYVDEENDAYVVEAPSGGKLAVVKLKITNTSGSDISVSLPKRGISYALSLGAGGSEKPLLTALMSDLQYYEATIPSGASREAVVAFAVDEDADLSGSALTVERKGKRASVPLR